METIFNLIWVLLATVIVRLWVSCGSRDGTNWSTQIAAVVLLILILFPVISVTDDLMATQNFAEDVFSARRDHAAAGSHSIHSTAAILPPAFGAGLFWGFFRHAAPSDLPAHAGNNPTLAAIRNRPPPMIFPGAFFV
jgi:hypothetical protein